MTHAIAVGHEWQVNISNDEHVCVATGETIEDALMNAYAKANEGKFTGLLIHMASHRYIGDQPIIPNTNAGRQLLASLGLGRKAQPIKRRI